MGRLLAARHITRVSSKEVLSFGGKGRQVSGPAADLQGPWRCPEAVMAVHVLNICEGGRSIFFGSKQGESLNGEPEWRVPRIPGTFIDSTFPCWFFAETVPSSLAITVYTCNR